MKRLIYPGIILAAVALAVVAAYLFFEKKTSAPITDHQSSKPSEKTGQICPAIAGKGQYIDYRDDLFSKECSGYSRTILFFFAPWCPECRGFDQAILAGTVPDATQIVKVDYDSSQELRKKYGVTIQSTFVSVDTQGSKLKLWSGYGKDKSVDTILENTK